MMTDKTPTVLYWNGRPVTDLSREELLEALTELVAQISQDRARELDRAQSLARRWSRAQGF